MSNPKNFYPYLSLELQIARLPRKMQEIDADDTPKWGQMAVYDCTIGQKELHNWQFQKELQNFMAISTLVDFVAISTLVDSSFSTTRMCSLEKREKSHEHKNTLWPWGQARPLTRNYATPFLSICRAL